MADGLEQHSENELPEKLKLHAVYYFGSLQKAKAAPETKKIHDVVNELRFFAPAPPH